MDKRKIGIYILQSMKKMQNAFDEVEKFGITIGNTKGSVISVDYFEEVLYMLYDVPKDTTVDVELENNNYFCRDPFGELIFKYQQSIISAEQVIYFFENWKKFYNDDGLFQEFFSKIENKEEVFV